MSDSHLSVGNYPSEEIGTMSLFGIPDHESRSSFAKAVWKAEVQESSSTQMGSLNLTITPPADAPIGEYSITVRYKDENTLLGELVVLYNPWCSGRLIIFYLLLLKCLNTSNLSTRLLIHSL